MNLLFWRRKWRLVASGWSMGSYLVLEECQLTGKQRARAHHETVCADRDPVWARAMLEDLPDAKRVPWTHWIEVGANHG